MKGNMVASHLMISCWLLLGVADKKKKKMVALHLCVSLLVIFQLFLVTIKETAISMVASHLHNFLLVILRISLVAFSF